jgi:hypothetical protein
VGIVGSELETTQLVGMAAALATAVKGREVVDDAVALKTVAAEQLDIDRFAFNSIVGILEEVDFVRNVRRTGGSITSFYESVPETFERLYATLGEVWAERAPGELERTLLGTVQGQLVFVVPTATRAHRLRKPGMAGRSHMTPKDASFRRASPQHAVQGRIKLPTPMTIQGVARR